MRVLQLAIILGVLALASRSQIPHPQVPDNIKAPAGEEIVLQARATGSQIYVCQVSAEQKLSWVLKAPEAKHTDGSEVMGKVVSRADAPEASAIPWLLLTATNHAGMGILSGVTTIQRIHTQGGQPPAGCDEAHRGSEIKVPYSADYYFYAPPR